MYLDIYILFSPKIGRLLNAKFVLLKLKCLYETKICELFTNCNSYFDQIVSLKNSFQSNTYNSLQARTNCKPTFFSKLNVNTKFLHIIYFAMLALFTVFSQLAKRYPICIADSAIAWTQKKSRGKF